VGDVIRFPLQAAPAANHTRVVWRGCWACGQLLFDDEPDLCPDCHHQLHHPPVETTGKRAHLLAWYLRHLRGDDIVGMASAIVDAGVEHAEAAAAAWAADHGLDGRARVRYVGSVRAACEANLTERCFDDAQQLGRRLQDARRRVQYHHVDAVEALGRLMGRAHR